MTWQQPCGGERPNRRSLARLGLFVFAIYLLSSPWRFPLSSDGGAMLATSRGLLTEQTLAVDASFTTDDGYVPSAKIGTDGRPYIKYGLGLPILEAPWVALALLLSRGAGINETDAFAAVLSLLNPLLTALTAVVVVMLAQAIGCSLLPALASGAAYALSTIAWPYAITDGSEALQSLCLALALLLLIKYSVEMKRWMIIASGAALAYAILTKPAAVIVFPILALYLVAVCLRRHVSKRESLLGLLRFAAPTAVCLFILAWLNLVRFGSWSDSGYNPQMFTNPFWKGVYGLLLSPNKGLIFYAPLALLSPVGLWLMRKTQLAEAGLILAVGLSCALINAKFFDWPGGWCYGPRYLAPALPALMAPIARAVAAARGFRHLAVALFLAGFAVNFLGALVNEDAYRSAIMRIDQSEATGTTRVGSLTEPGEIHEIAVRVEDVLPEFSSILGHAWLARVAFDGCECSEQTAECACRDGDFEANPHFAAPPWMRRYPEAQPIPPYGARIIQPWLLNRLYRWLIYDPDDRTISRAFSITFSSNPNPSSQNVFRCARHHVHWRFA
jgi:hypothetical protein